MEPTRAAACDQVSQLSSLEGEAMLQKLQTLRDYVIYITHVPATAEDSKCNVPDPPLSRQNDLNTRNERDAASGPMHLLVGQRHGAEGQARPCGLSQSPNSYASLH